MHGATRFCKCQPLRLLDSHQDIQGVLYFVEEKTREMTLSNELLSANAAKDQFSRSFPRTAQSPFARDRDGANWKHTWLIQPSASGVDGSRRNVERTRLIDDRLDITSIAKKTQAQSRTGSVHNVCSVPEICHGKFAKSAQDRN